MDLLEWEAIAGYVDVRTIEDLIERPAWMRDALCREFPEAEFFIERGGGTGPAKGICRRCLVREECLAFALAVPSWADFGVWGGTSVQERRRIRDDVKPPLPPAGPHPCSTCGHIIPTGRGKECQTCRRRASMRRRRAA